MAKSDPRPDRSNDGPKYPDPGENKSRPAEDGIGTGTKTEEVTTLGMQL